MAHKFGKIAEWYDASLTDLSQNYVELIHSLFKIHENDHIIDLGCGSGLLTFKLAKYATHVYGLDCSEALLNIARRRDFGGQISWIQSRVETFDFIPNKYKLIISYEAFHLFPEPDKLVQKIANALQKHGYFCIGWCTYHWEIALKDIIRSVFKSFGILWGKWGFQSCPNLREILKNSDINLSPLVEKHITVNSSTDVGQIALYLSSIDKASSLNVEMRKSLANNLEKKIRDRVNSEVIHGRSIYSFAYCLKL